MLMINGWLGPIGAIGFLYMQKSVHIAKHLNQNKRKEVE